MASFVIRVELIGHGYDGAAYPRLHEAFVSRNILNTIKGDKGTSFQLPPATYAYEGSFTIEAVRDWISSVVGSLGYKSSIVVTEGLSAWLLPQA